jgi:hypothetical protein
LLCKEFNMLAACKVQFDAGNFMRTVAEVPMAAAHRTARVAGKIVGGIYGTCILVRALGKMLGATYSAEGRAAFLYGRQEPASSEKPNHHHNPVGLPKPRSVEEMPFVPIENITIDQYKAVSFIFRIFSIEIRRSLLALLDGSLHVTYLIPNRAWFQAVNLSLL